MSMSFSLFWTRVFVVSILESSPDYISLNHKFPRKEVTEEELV